MTYRCESCKETFDEPIIKRQPTGNDYSVYVGGAHAHTYAEWQSWEACPHCSSEYFEDADEEADEEPAWWAETNSYLRGCVGFR